MKTEPTQSTPVTGEFNWEESGWRLVLIALACMISVFLDQATSGLEQAISNYVTGTLGGSSDEGLWLQIGYNACYYLSLIASPWTITKFGRRNTWMYGHAMFAIASVAIALTHNLWGVVALRAMQGLGQGTFFVIAVMTVLRIFPKPIAFIGFALFAITSLSGPALGPAIGGWFSDQNAWQLAFVTEALMASTASLIIAFVLRDPPGSRVPTTPTDFLGLFLALLHYLTYHFVTIEGERRDWLGNSKIAAVTLLFTIVTVVFFWWEYRYTKPFILLRLFRSHNLRIGAFLGFFLGVPLFGGNIFLQYLQTGISFTPGLAGGELALRVFTIVLTIPFIAYSLGKNLIDVRYFIITGFVLVAISYGLLYWETTYLSDFGTFVVPFILQGVAFSLLFSPIIRTVLSSLPAEDFTHGIAIFKLTLVTGGSFAATLLGYIVDHRATLHFSQITEGINLSQPAFSTYFQSPFPHPLIVLAGVAQQQSYISAYADANLYVSILALCVAPLALLLRPPPRRL